MFGNYKLDVFDAGPTQPRSRQANMAVRLDQTMHSPYSHHIVIGHHANEEMLLVACGATVTEERDALVQACGFYSNQFACWPEFFSSQCKLRNLVVHGFATPACTEF